MAEPVRPAGQDPLPAGAETPPQPPKEPREIRGTYGQPDYSPAAQKSRFQTNLPTDTPGKRDEPPGS